MIVIFDVGYIYIRLRVVGGEGGRGKWADLLHFL